MTQDTLRPMHLPRRARRKNLRRIGAPGFEGRMQRNREERLAAREKAGADNEAARVFWNRCWAALAPELLAWGNSVATDAERPHQEDVDLMMGQIGALPLVTQAKYAGLKDEGIVHFVRDVVKKHRARRAEADKEQAERITG